jgi:hypothetical protein
MNRSVRPIRDALAHGLPNVVEPIDRNAVSRK